MVGLDGKATFPPKNGDRTTYLVPNSTTSTPWLTVYLSTWIGPRI